MDYPKLSTPILLGLLAILCLALAWKQEEWPEWLRLCLVAAGMFLLFWTLVTTLNTIHFASNKRYDEYQRSAAITERVAVLEKLRQLSPEQLKALDRYVPVIGIIAGDEGPAYMLHLPTQNVPMTFVRELLGLSDEEYMAPIRTYGEGTKEREWAQGFTGYAIFNGWATPASGPYSARWINRERCLKAIGLRMGSSFTTEAQRH
jgi:hypothetical protein